MRCACLSSLSALSPGSYLRFSILLSDSSSKARSITPSLSLDSTSAEKIWWAPDVQHGGGGTRSRESLSPRGVWKHKPAARGFWKIRVEVRWIACSDRESLGSLLVEDGGVWEMLPASPWHIAVAALGCWEKALRFLPLSTFICNCSCISKSLMLGLVFMGFTEKLSFREDKTLHL